MMPHLCKNGITLYCGDCYEVLKSFPNDYVNCCVTSPPYYDMRDYHVNGQIGMGQTVGEYIQALVRVSGEIRRTLRHDGTLWTNIGDTYTSGNRNRRATDAKNPIRELDYRAPTPTGLKPKDLIGIPWRLAFALQEDGWYLRQEIIWEKPNCFPESVKDRCTKSRQLPSAKTEGL